METKKDDDSVIQPKKERLLNSLRFFALLMLLLIIITGGMYYYIMRDIQKTNIHNTDQVIKQTLCQLDKNVHRASDKEKIDILVDIVVSFKPKVSSCLMNPIIATIFNECKAKELDPFLITALIYVESRFDAVALSTKKAMGLMQVRYPTWKESQMFKKHKIKCANDLYRPMVNIRCGTSIFKKYYKESNHNIAKTLYRYNNGSTKLSKEPFEIAYINKIMYYHYLILSMFGEKLKENKTKIGKGGKLK